MQVGTACYSSISTLNPGEKLLHHRFCGLPTDRTQGFHGDRLCRSDCELKKAVFRQKPEASHGRKEEVTTCVEQESQPML